MKALSLFTLTCALVAACSTVDSTDPKQDEDLSPVAIERDGNAACAACCRANFPPGPARGRCVSESARGNPPPVCAGCRGPVDAGAEAAADAAPEAAVDAAPEAAVDAAPEAAVDAAAEAGTDAAPDTAPPPPTVVQKR